MCGIAGIVGTRDAEFPRLAQRMAQAMIHRGPDGEGAFNAPGVSLVHRRLAIIDLIGGRQPLANADASIQVVCNGEIYNYRELRRELEALGHRFTTASDCEVAVHGYAAWGDDVVLHLRGMFALAVLDLPRRRLLLARDHLGIKPLFWHAVPGATAFASELIALRKADLSRWQPDLAAIDLYLRLQYIPSPYTVWQGVQRLAPAHRLVIGLDGMVGVPERYWDCPYAPHERSDAELRSELAATVDASIRMHLVSDVPFGALLSGGVDSAGIVAGMVGHLPDGVRTFTIGADGNPSDERQFARAMADHIGALHTDDAVIADPLMLLPSMLDGHGQPFADDSAIPTWQVARLARQQVKMVLTGDGGDELFAGYGSYSGWLNWLAASGASPWRRLARHLAGLAAPSRFPPRHPTTTAWVALNEVLPFSVRQGLWRRDYRPDSVDLPEGFRLPESASDLPPLAMAQRLDMRTYLPDCVLAKVDAASMAHGLEVRTPLVDREVANWAMSVPCERNLDTAGRGKRLWRQHVAQAAPPGHLDRQKLGFAAPLSRWCSSQTDTGQAIHRQLGDPASPLRMWFDSAALDRLISQNEPKRIWLLLVLDSWLRRESA